jgi:hypothetical protein
MSTDQPNLPPEQAPPQSPEQQADQQQPRDDQGRFTTPTPPVVEQQPQGPQPPTAPRVDPNEAVQFYERFANPRSRAETFFALGREYGFIPEGLTPDQAREAMEEYQAWLAQQQQQAPPQVGTPGVPQAQAGYEQPPGYGVPQQPMVDPALQQRIDALEQQIMQQQRQEQIGTIRSAAAAVAEQAGLDPQAASVLERNIALGIDAAIESGQEINWDPRAMRDYAQQVYDQLRSLAAAQAAAQQQAEIAQHRGVAPRTVVPQGDPQSGQQVPRGIQGAIARAQQAARGAQQG